MERKKLWHSVYHSLQYSYASLLVNALSFVGKRPQKIIKSIKFMEFQKSSIKHLERQHYHMQDEQYLSKNAARG